MPFKKSIINNENEELEKWIESMNDTFLNHESEMFTFRFENKNYYAEAHSCISSKRISIWDKTLNTEKINIDKKSNLFSEDCSICLSKLKNKSLLKITSCGHVFHKKCLEKYISTIHDSGTVPLCPLCRSGNSDSLKQIEERKRFWDESFTNYESDSSYYSSD
jgi:hypothetical protein